MNEYFKDYKSLKSNLSLLTQKFSIFYAMSDTLIVELNTLNDYFLRINLYLTDLVLKIERMEVTNDEKAKNFKDYEAFDKNLIGLNLYIKNVTLNIENLSKLIRDNNEGNNIYKVLFF